MPDFFGRIIDYKELIETAHAHGALVAMAVNPTALGLLTLLAISEPISRLEGQPLGIPLSLAVPISDSLQSKRAFAQDRRSLGWSNRGCGRKTGLRPDPHSP